MKNDTTYNNIDAFIEAHEGLWCMFKTVTYKKVGKRIEVYDNGQFVKHFIIN